jgi:hypothetical protein
MRVAYCGSGFSFYRCFIKEDARILSYECVNYCDCSTVLNSALSTYFHELRYEHHSSAFLPSVITTWIAFRLAK